MFWEYKLGNGQPAFLFACAPKADVNCDDRMPMICVVRLRELRRLNAARLVSIMAFRRESRRALQIRAVSSVGRALDF